MSHLTFLFVVEKPNHQDEQKGSIGDVFGERHYSGETVGWGFPCTGWGVKSSSAPTKPRDPKLFWLGYSEKSLDIPDPWGVLKTSVPRRLAFIFVSRS